MSRYDESFKASVVGLYAGGDESYASVGLAYGIDAATVRKWVAIHGEHGFAGLARKFSRYDGTFKLSVLKRMWEDGLSYRRTAAVFNIRNAGCLAEWERRYAAGGLDALEPRRKGRPRRMPQPPAAKPPSTQPPGGATSQGDETRSREELLAELRYLRMENAYLKKLEALTQGRAPKERKPSRR